MYDRDMLGEDVSGRFDYLFEPLKVDESAGNGDDVAPRSLAEPENRSRWSSRIVLASVVLATLAAATATVVVLLQPVQPVPQIDIPRGAATPSSTVSPVESAPTPTTTAESVPVLPATVSTPATPVPSPRAIAPRPPPPPQPTTVASEPADTMPPSPTTRAPISVSPEPRPPFPDQTPPKKNDQGGGLLGGLL
jgi:cytoskeletal protein RodZ